jgi:SAM-dependent methyltransferase
MSQAQEVPVTSTRSPAELKQHQRYAWGAAPWEPMAARLAPLHDDLVARLGPKPGERWLDVGTGTGAVALRAARAGARVTGVDLSPVMVRTARRSALREGLPAWFEVGDVERLFFSDGGFDAVSSALGVFLAPDHAAAAAELARVCRRGGRLGLVAWRPDPELDALHAPYRDERCPDCGDRRNWGREEYVRGLLGGDFELAFAEGELRLRAASGEQAWRHYTSHEGPAKLLVDALDPERAEHYRRSFVRYWERHRDGRGVSLLRRYLVTIGRRK